jgi:hypothetical protein
VRFDADAPDGLAKCARRPGALLSSTTKSVPDLLKSPSGKVRAAGPRLTSPYANTAEPAPSGTRLAAVSIGPAVQNARHLYRYSPDPGRDVTLQQEAMAHQTMTAVFVQEMGLVCNEGDDFGLDRGAKELNRSCGGHRSQRIRPKLRSQ